MSIAEEYRLECEADAIIRESCPEEDEYPAYSERDLARKAEMRGEVTESEILCESGQQEEGTQCAQGLLEMGRPLYDGPNPLYHSSRVRPGYGLLLTMLVPKAGLTARQRAIVRLTMAGMSLRRIADKTGIAKSTIERELQAAVELLQQRRAQLEKDYDMERTAAVLHLQRTCLPEKAARDECFVQWEYVEKLESIMAGATKPILVGLRRRRQPSMREIAMLAAGIPRGNRGSRGSRGNRGSRECRGIGRGSLH